MLDFLVQKVYDGFIKQGGPLEVTHETGKATITRVANRYEIRLWEGLGWSKVRYATNRRAAEAEAKRIETRWAAYVAYLNERNNQ